MKAYYADRRADRSDWFTIYTGESLEDARTEVEKDFKYLTAFERLELKKKNGVYVISCYEADGETTDEVLENALEDLNPDQFMIFQESYKIGFEELVKY